MIRPRLALGLLLTAALAAPAAAGDTPLVTAAGTFTVPVVSLREARFHTVVRQQYDFSCGSAALATLLTYHYGRPTTEEEAFRAMFAAGDQAAIKKFGFSLYDMQQYLTAKGLSSDGFKVPLERLVEVGVPAITLISTKGYNHFVVVKGIKDGDVLVGDPALGLKTVPRAEFEAMWRGVMFVIRDELATGRQNFNLDHEWAVRRKAPFGTALNRDGLATFATMMPGFHEF
jgi:predicted double-glycine peptidase